ncbi:MAG: SRPBCC family protein [Xanthobacteraceae bacterium]
MTSTITIAPVRKTIRVKAPQERAFEVFTVGMGRWWARQYSINKSPIKDIVVEPRAGGRWFERGEDGSECQWGKVLAWEPPGRLLLAWQIAANWQFDPSIVTELEIRFIADGTGTLVELEHRNLERLGAAAEEFRHAFDSPQGWAGLLETFARQAE